MTFEERCSRLLAAGTISGGIERLDETRLCVLAIRCIRREPDRVREGRSRPARIAEGVQPETTELERSESRSRVARELRAERIERCRGFARAIRDPGSFGASEELRRPHMVDWSMGSSGRRGNNGGPLRRRLGR